MERGKNNKEVRQFGKYVATNQNNKEVGQFRKYPVGGKKGKEVKGKKAGHQHLILQYCNVYYTNIAVNIYCTVTSEFSVRIYCI